jgi:2-polyprenyl-3-methyl-5-hydroxy-6-metoxy-1,4-benzoquinol methylase
VSHTGFAQTDAPAYFDAERWDMLAELEPPYGRVLDVGCGTGATARSLRERGAEQLVGVEPTPAAAAAAREVFDTLHEGRIEDVIGSGVLTGPFDCILLYDVLEHLVDPSAVLDALRPLAAPGGRVHVSVPNARHWSLVRDLLLRGTFGYTEWGHRDATHLRWFTRRDIEALVTGADFRVERSNGGVFGRNVAVNRLTGGRLEELVALQWHVLARA